MSNNIDKSKLVNFISNEIKNKCHLFEEDCSLIEKKIIEARKDAYLTILTKVVNGEFELIHINDEECDKLAKFLLSFAKAYATDEMLNLLDSYTSITDLVRKYSDSESQ